MRRLACVGLLAAACGFVPALTRALPAPADSGYVAVAGGRIFYESYGTGFPLVLMHDGLAHREVWDAQVDAFAPDYRVIRYDRRGFGRSPVPTAAFSDLDDLTALLDTLRVPRAVLVGSSYAGGLAINFTLDHPDRVEALVLSGPVVNGLGYSAHIMRRELANYSRDPQERIAKCVADPYTIAPGNDAARRRLAELFAAFPNDLNNGQDRYLQTPDRPALPRLAEIHVPTLIVTADRDIPDVHAHAGAIEAGIVGARRLVLPNAGHLVYLEQPAAFNAAVAEFLALISLPTNRQLAAHATAPWTTLRRGFAPVDGSALYYEEMGDGPPLVLIHGGYLDHRMWDDQFAALARRFRVIRYDVRGCGLSRSPYGDRRDHEDLRRLLEDLGIDRANLVGLSLGGVISIDFALTHPDMVSSLVLVSPGVSGYDFTSDNWRENRKCLVDAYLRSDFPAAADCFMRSWTDGPRRTPEQVDPAVRERVHRMVVEGIQPGKDEYRALPPEPPALGRLAEIHTPVLAILGELDMTEIHDIVDRIAKEVPGARKAVFPRAAHMVNLEEPARFEQAVLEFLDRVAAGR